MYEVKRLACFASEYENDFIKAMIGRSAKEAENGRIRKQRELDALTARDRELDMLFERLYEDNVAGKISGGTACSPPIRMRRSAPSDSSPPAQVR